MGAGSWKRDLGALAAIAGAYALLMLVGITCPIKFVTGLSCPGCGMTRAWLSALRLDFAAALAYHPLFWLVPPAGALYLLRERLPAKWVKTLAWALCAAFCAVYGVRLVTGSAPEVVVWAPERGLLGRLWTGLRALL